MEFNKAVEVCLTLYPQTMIQETANYFRLRGDEPLLSLSESPRRIPSPLGNRSDTGFPNSPFEHIAQNISTLTMDNPLGYLGKSSCLWWFQRAREQMGKSMPLVVAIGTMVDSQVPAVEKLGAFPTLIFLYYLPSSYRTPRSTNC